MAEPNLTSEETRLVERYLGVCDFLSRCAQAIDEGHWHYLQDKAAQLHGAAGRFADEALTAYQARRKPRHQLVVAGLRWWGRHYRVSRLLHPINRPPTPSDAGAIVLAVAGDVGLAMDEARLARLIEEAGEIARRTDLDPAAVLRVLASLTRYEVRDDQ